jgi:hypothetical protein
MALPGQISVGSKGGIVLLNGVTATTAAPTLANQGFLYEAKGFKAYTFQVKGITTATVQFYGTIDPAAGANPTGSQAVNWTVLTASGVTADGFTILSGPFVAVAAAVTAYTSGTIFVYCFAVP